ncbi:Cyclolysin secretion/processing ATP-binding protein CyaB [Seminavis robusta]|uniref:Cyclolysin secretion/processing ATP-binding protein CyaB n=1 Tax=Seminavis robusta TaxID=568900 RepID=A0A9N8EQ93_9STRA|nr:Cyclolysin secretion/processing ATP-binding protein CyaB [Seminavis robusta]|eukprot:Sro1588_g284280.1 Cyclolysin secretion/processing ATP-binding protein CyaB (575) ;mRNA; f:8246-10069
MVKSVPDSLFFALKVSWALLQVIQKWWNSVVLRKLLYVSFAFDERRPTSPLLNFLFLDNLSFFAVMGLTVLCSWSLAAVSALVTSCSLARSKNESRALRMEILTKAVTLPSGTNTNDVAQMANELLVKVKVIEEFQAHVEPFNTKCKVVLVLSLVLSFAFAWYAGLTAVTLFVVTCLVGFGFAKLRKPLQSITEQNSVEMNAFLLDVIRNSTKVQGMNQLKEEQETLGRLEEENNKVLEKELIVAFLSKAVRVFLIGIIPVLIRLEAWFVIESVLQYPAEAFDIASAVMAASLLMDDAHKAITQLIFAKEQEISSIHATKAIHRYIGCSAKSHRGDTKTNKQEDAFLASLTEELSLSSTDSDENVMEMGQAGQKRGHSFARGKIHVLVGESGRGKTTLLNVIGGLLQPQQGSMIFWKGMKTAFVSQHQTLFARTIRENVTYGHSRLPTDQEIWASLDAACVGDFVRSLPNGLDETLVQGEQGVSGGQLQRINLAHLFCSCQDADLIILDEVLSALDPESRKTLLGKLKVFLEGKTAIIVTHHHNLMNDLCAEVHDMSLDPVLNVSEYFEGDVEC